MKNTLHDIYEGKKDIKKAQNQLTDFNVYGIAELSNIISDELLDRGDVKKNDEWLKLTNELRLKIFEVEDWIKKNVK